MRPQARLPRSTFGLAALASVGLSVATLMIGVAILFVSHEALERQLDHRIDAETRYLLAVGAELGRPALVAAIARREDGHRTGGMGYMLFDAAGAKLAGRFEAQRPGPGWHELLPYSEPTGTPHDEQTAQALATPLPDGGLLVVAADRTPIDEIDRSVLRMFVVAFGAMLLAGVACAWGIGLVVRRRLDRFNRTAEAIIGGDRSQRMSSQGAANEFDRLAETLNRLLDRNADLLDNLRRVTSDIAHDLRTPLARQKQILDAALEHPASHERLLAGVAEAARLSQETLDIFAALLRISEVDTHRIRLSFRPVRLAAVAERVVDAFRASAEDSGHRLRVAQVDDAVVSGDSQLLVQLLANLVENALAHTPSGTAIDVRVRRGPATAELEIVDDGPGIPAADRQRVLERFVRLERSRSRPGHGLGMSLVDAIARAHYGRLELGDARPGLRVTVRLPPAPPDD